MIITYTSNNKTVKVYATQIQFKTVEEKTYIKYDGGHYLIPLNNVKDISIV